MIRRTLLLASALLLPLAAQADPADDFAWVMNRGAQVPLATVLHDEAGRDLTLAAAGAGKPVILDLGYFHCPTLCGVVRNDLLAALKTSGLTENQDYALVSLSIDPAETPKDAADAKAADLAQSGFATGAGWHYMTGTDQSVAAITSVVGFRSRWDAQFKQFMHPTGLVVLTRTGLVSGYLQGVGYSGGELRAAVLRAGDGGIAAAALPILLMCFHFDSTTGRYTLEIMKLIRLAGGLTVVTILGLLFVLHRRRRAMLAP